MAKDSCCWHTAFVVCCIHNWMLKSNRNLDSWPLLWKLLMSRLLTSLITKISSLLPLCLFTYLWNFMQPLPSFLSRDVKSNSCAFFLANSNYFDSHFSSF
jgi:hypothetical protein